MALNLFVVFEGEQVDEGLEEARLDDRGLILWVYRDIANTGS
jgi:hypothetical protein